MRKISKTLFSSFLTLIVIVIGNYVIVAQSTLTGTWKAETKADKPEKIYLSFSRKTEKGNNNNMGTTYDYADLKGLSREQSLANGAVRFSLVREAGTIDCEGAFTGGKGSGTFLFTANRSFVDAMKSRGFDFETSRAKYDEDNIENRLFAAATLNVTTALADDLLSANFGKLHVDDLFKGAIFKVDSKFMREMKDSGFQGLTFEDLVKARIFKIDAEFVKDVAAKGFSNEPFESLVNMRIFKITPEFITEVRNEGFQNIEIKQLVKMKIFNINAEFIRQARADGVPMEVEKLVQKRIGVYRSREN
jgi:ABC-type antimicrobial peptide transport system permease subunit